MFHLNNRDGPSPKCYLTCSILPSFVDHDQIPSKKKPFSTISAQQFNHTVSLLLPQETANNFKQTFTGGVGTTQYARVYMKLNELIEGDFFNQYIKTGDVLMLSEGRPGLDHIFSLCEGMLRLEVDKPTYERMGLEGVSIASGGRKHVKARYAIELNLRLPSMVRGKKGFERIVWAFKNVLNHSVTWLFYDVKAQTVDSGPLGSHQPKMLNLEPRLETMAGVEVPELPQDFQQEEYATATELLEWLSLAISGSPRIQSDDRIDPYLSRYRVPPPVDSASDMTSRNAQDVVRFCWHGFIPPNFIKDVFLAAIKVSGTDWCGMSAVAFDGKAYSLLQHNRHTMTWEYMD